MADSKGTARFNFDIQNMFDADASKMATETVNEQHKYLSPKAGGKLPRTSASTTTGGDPTATTVFTISEVLQRVPEFTSPASTLKNYQDMLDTDVAMGLGDGKNEESDWSKYVKTGLLSPDIIRSVQALKDTHDLIHGADTVGDNSGLEVGVTIDDLKKDARITFIDPTFETAARDGKIHVYLLWLAKRIVDTGYTPLRIIAGMRPLDHGGASGLHAQGWAMDIRSSDGGNSLAGDPWIRGVCSLLDSIPSPKRPDEVGGPSQYAGGPGTNWFTTPELADRLHIGYTHAPTPEISGTSSGNALAIIGTVTPGPAPPRSTTKDNVDFVRVALTQVGPTKYVYGASADPNDPNPKAFDCSELIQWATQRVGITTMQGTAGSMYDAAQKAGLLIPPEQATKTIGACLFRSATAHKGYGEHIAICLGDGAHTIEAHSSADGVLSLDVGLDKRGWTSGLLIPTMIYRPPDAAAGSSATTGAASPNLGPQKAVIAPSADQLAIINTIVGVGKQIISADASLTAYGKMQVLVSALETAWVESTMANLTGGDGSSVGVFQIISSNGSYDQRHNVDWSARWFLNQAVGSPYKNGKGTAGQMAQSVQRAAAQYASEKDKWRNQAVADLARINIDASMVDSVAVTSTASGSSTPQPTTALTDYLDEVHANYVEEGDWANRVRAGPWMPVGVMIHHTASAANSGDVPFLEILRDKGEKDSKDGHLIDAPMVTFLIGRSGKAHLISGGRVNHAGAGMRSVLESTKQGIAPTSNATGANDVDYDESDNYWYGIEVENSGKGEPYPDAVIDTLVKCCTAICSMHGWTSSHVIHHREWTKDKVDMSYTGDIRGKVAVALASIVAP